MILGIACGSGGYRTVFIHGVLSALEDGGLRGSVYAGTSASTLAAASAAVGAANSVGVAYWQHGLAIQGVSEVGMSAVSLQTIAEQSPFLIPRLFAPEAPDFVVPACAVITEAGAAETQSSASRRLGRRLLLSAARREPNPWVAENLALHLYDTGADGSKSGWLPLTPENFAEVAYATSRMMHAWDIPATINAQPYVDASYHCSIPAVELIERGCDAVIAISADPPGTVYRDVFGTRALPDSIEGKPIHLITPPHDPGPMGADFTDATDEGLAEVYAMGQAMGRSFLAGWMD